MGSDNFFSKLASIDPIAQAFDLPGAHKYAQSRAQDVQTNPGPYAGVTPTLAAANAGYRPGGPGAQQGWTPNQAQSSGFWNGGWGGKLQGAANLSGNVTGGGPGSIISGRGPPTPSLSTGNPYVQNSQTINPYVTAARNAGAQQGGWGGIGQQPQRAWSD